MKDTRFHWIKVRGQYLFRYIEKTTGLVWGILWHEVGGGWRGMDCQTYQEGLLFDNRYAAMENVASVCEGSERPTIKTLKTNNSKFALKDYTLICGAAGTIEGLLLRAPDPHIYDNKIAAIREVADKILKELQK